MKRTLQIGLSVLLSIVFIWLSLRGTDLAEVGHAIAGADPRYVLLYLLALVLVHVVRIVRWGLLLKPLANVRFSEVNALGAVGFLALMVLPLRLGEFARPMLVAEHLKVRRSASFASVVVERIVDGLLMGLVLVVLLWGLGGQLSGEHVERVRVGGALVTLAFGAGLVALVVAFRQRAFAERLIRSVVGRFSPNLAEKLCGIVGGFTDGLHVVPSFGAFAKVLGLTVVYWGINAASLFLLAPAFGFHLAPLQALTVLGLQVIGSMIPAGPGMVGTLQFFTRLGIGLFLPGPEMAVRAAAFAHTSWAMQFAQQVLFGLYFVANGRVPLTRLFGRLARGEVAATESAEVATALDTDAGRR